MGNRQSENTVLRASGFADLNRGWEGLGSRGTASCQAIENRCQKGSLPSLWAAARLAAAAQLQLLHRRDGLAGPDWRNSDRLLHSAALKVGLSGSRLGLRGGCSEGLSPPASLRGKRLALPEEVRGGGQERTTHHRVVPCLAPRSRLIISIIPRNGERNKEIEDWEVAGLQPSE
jgi:hypothetical protein